MTSNPNEQEFIPTHLNVSSTAIGIRFENGVVIAADNLVRCQNVQLCHTMDRVLKINEHILLSGIGDFPDILDMKKSLDQIVVRDHCWNDGIELRPENALHWLHNLNRERRLQFKPYCAQMIVGGIRANGSPVLGKMNELGQVEYKKYAAVGGTGPLLANSLIRAAKPADRPFTMSEAVDLISLCMRSIYFRDNATICNYTVGICTSNECLIKGPFNIDENWALRFTIDL